MTRPIIVSGVNIDDLLDARPGGVIRGVDTMLRLRGVRGVEQEFLPAAQAIIDEEDAKGEECRGCGAPVERHRLDCAYCRRAYL